MASTTPSPLQRFVKRARVPLGFVVATLTLVFAHPTSRSLLYGLPLVLAGLWLRGYAAGYVRKNAELTVTGPYAFTRNPLYLGSLAIAAGFGLATGKLWLLAAILAVFLLIYIPTILGEELYLRAHFSNFDAYAAQVPRLLPRLTPAGSRDALGRFDAQRYRHHREYNALIGAAAIYAVLLVRLCWFGR